MSAALPLALTMGEPAGIGGELTLTWAETPRVPHPASGEHHRPARRAERRVRRHA